MALEGEVLKLALEIHTDDVNELCTFGLHSGDGARSDANINSMLNTLVTEYTTFSSGGYVTPQHITAAVAFKWEVGADFTGWHQYIRSTRNVALGSGSQLPPQIAAVIGYRTDDVVFSSVPIGRRRNRCYIGPLGVTTLGSDGRFQGTMKTRMANLLKNCHDAWVTVGGVGGVLNENGLVVVSAVGNSHMPANIISVGAIPDTMRSRRQQEPETPAATAITPG